MRWRRIHAIISTMVARNPLDALRSLPAGGRLLDAMAQAPGAYLVGGAVRDLLLGRTPRELDVVVEGDLTALAAALGGRLVAHDRFGTATVAVGDDTYDLAQARRETYAHAGALPDVEPADLAEDLRRRDVTINAIAMAPTGVLTAVDGALDDLEAGVLRVLHDRSFVDDPTRLWRVARYGARLGFAPDEHTAALARRAVEDGALATVSGPRVGAEVRLALREPDPHAALVRAHRLGLLPAGFGPPGPRAAVAAGLLPEDGRRDLLTLAAWAVATDPAALRHWLDDLAFPAEDRDVVCAAALAPGRLSFPERASLLARRLRGVPVEAVALAGAAHDPGAARRWIEELRHVRLAIGGDDLLAADIPAGPEIGERLGRALDAALDGDAPGRDEQLRVALAG
jgi:tRNA nucleotidyltransferase (CCA-adding enzyme)